jgi:hypothetical protein
VNVEAAVCVVLTVESAVLEGVTVGVWEAEFEPVMVVDVV